MEKHQRDNKYLLLIEFEVRTVSYGPIVFFRSDLHVWPKCKARGPKTRVEKRGVQNKLALYKEVTTMETFYFV